MVYHCQTAIMNKLLMTENQQFGYFIIISLNYNSVATCNA